MSHPIFLAGQGNSTIPCILSISRFSAGTRKMKSCFLVVYNNNHPPKIFVSPRMAQCLQVNSSFGRSSNRRRRSVSISAPLLRIISASSSGIGGRSVVHLSSSSVCSVAAHLAQKKWRAKNRKIYFQKYVFVFYAFRTHSSISISTFVAATAGE